ncbi:outer membrane lipoprotein chaperone LolA [Dechloromonas sp. TW-R-39-2]|uniref:outer membrane lipoprotein chaperone LolA n=1 Tax=Dechloromonas sp. TW-R-39-2 TaxID=2654218 RepID=UPI00193D6CF5|nr:outer membrane lipoprotein chaperone LolA [Dechloromonas sp. TW-R-39-2]QRM20121.1 outer membrane lipoprotein chaperone LolA [Dechloromonas sp. TW-R-39-2]
MKFVQKTLLTAAIAIFPLLAEAGALDQLHQFLQNTRTLKAEFAQTVIGKNGRKPQQSSGLVAISRPGKLRWEIVKPYPQLVVGDGDKIWIYDPELQQVTVRKAGQAISGSPAALLSGNNDLEKNFTLKEAGEAEGMLWLEATPKNGDSGFDKVRLGFASSDLKAMELQDSFGQTTLIRFSKVERNPALSAGTFKFTPPAGVDVVGE